MAYLHVKATVDDYDEWKSDFEDYHSRRADYGGKSYRLFRTTDNPNEIVVLIEFDEEENARAWTEHLESEEGLTEPDMVGVEISYLTMVEGEQLKPA